MKELASFSLLDPLILDNVIKEFTPTGVFHDEIELLGSFNDLKKKTN
jgi:hypothetical protein